MKKLVHGIIDFRKKLRPEYREIFTKLALGQSPDALLIACSDSRVVPNLFASTEPGDLFVFRNIGNLIPPCGADGVCASDQSEAAAIEFALMQLNVSDIIICGHSECGAMHALLSGRENVSAPNLRDWLRHGDRSLGKLKEQSSSLKPHNHLSQLNVLEQLENLRSYPEVKKRISEGTLRLHGWWFELQNAEVHAYDEVSKRFLPIDENVAEKILARLQ